MIDGRIVGGSGAGSAPGLELLVIPDVLIAEGSIAPEAGVGGELAAARHAPGRHRPLALRGV